MKTRKNIKNNMEYPKYKHMIPLLICIYMIGSLLINGMDNKSFLLVITSVAMVAWFIGERIFPDKVYIDGKGKISKIIYALMGIFILAVIISQMFSKDYSYSALVGDSESVMNIFCYIVLFYMAYRYGSEEKNQKIFKWAIILLSIVTVIMSMVEFYDIPLARLWLNNGESLADINRVVLSFGNSNYYGAFCCMIIPLVIKLWADADSRINKWAYMLLNASLMCCIFMSKSTMAIVLMIITILGVFLYEFKAVLKQWKYVIVFILVFIGEVFVINICSGGKLMQLVDIGVSNSDAFVEGNGEKYIIENIKLNGNRLELEGENSKIIMEYSDQFIFYDEEECILDIDSEGGVISFVEEPYNKIEIMISYDKRANMMLAEVDAGYKETIDFYIKDGEFKGVGADGKAVDDISGKYIDYKLNNIFTGRGYIWINTVSILDEVIFIGKGFGNYVNVFKQYDYVGLLKSQGTTNIIIDRPHNMFLQYCVDIGIIGTVAMFAMIIYILGSWIKQCQKNGRDRSFFSYSTFAGTLVFLMFSMLNDSMVVLSPFMWFVLGINLAVQNKHRNKSGQN